MASIVVSPPPTTNWLTMRERAQLRRKAKKLGQLLGSVPHVIDGSDASRDSILPSSSSTKSSISSGSSRPSTDSTFSGLSRTTSLSSYERPKESRSSIRSRRAFSGDSWPKALPLLRLSKPSPSLRSIPGSPAHPEDPHYLSFSSALSSSDSDDEDSPTSKTPSPHTSRRHKMDKLRRTLGDGVPLHLVFPAERPTPKSSQAQTPLPPIIDIAAPSPVTEATNLPPVPATRHSSPRDSMSFPSPHKAPRIVKRKPVPMLIPTRAVPPPPPTSIEELERAIDEDMQRLFDILEDDGNVSEAPSEGRWSIVSPHTSSLLEEDNL